MTNLHRLIDRLSGSNAQLFRELQGRLTGFNWLWVTVTALLIQAIYLFVFLMQLPSNPEAGAPNSYQRYCLLEAHHAFCQLDSLGKVVVNWSEWWGDLFQSIAWVVPLILIAGSTYLLASDLRREQQRGTLNFIRLSPQSASQFLWGKLLGVPVLVYGFVALFTPLELWAGANSNSGFINTVLWQLQILAIAGIFLLMTAFFSMLVAIWPIAITGLNLWLSFIGLQLSNTILHLSPTLESSYPEAKVLWFFWPLGNPASIFLFGIGSCCLASYWLWQTIVRRYQNPQGTLLAKTDSYRLNLCLQLWLLGFAVPLAISFRSTLPMFLIGVVLIQMVATLIALLLLIPNRQTIQDWSRYRRERQARRTPWGSTDLYRDLLLDDRSPAALALGTNLLLAMVLWIPCSWLAFENPMQSFKAILALLIAVIFLFNYSTVIQIVITRHKKEWAWAQTTLFTVLTVALPLLGAALASYGGLASLSSLLMVLFSPLALFNPPFFPIAALGIGLVGQAAIGLWLTGQLSRQVKSMGRSLTATALA